MHVIVYIFILMFNAIMFDSMRRTFTKTGLAKYIPAIENNTATVVCLSLDRVNDKMARRIAKALETNTTLVYLNLYGNLITDDGIKHIAQALEINSTLNTLTLGHNLMTDDGVAYIAHALKKIRRSQSLTYSRTTLALLG